MGQQSGNVARMFASRSQIICATRKIFFYQEALSSDCALIVLRVQIDAAMHNRDSKTDPQIGFDSGIKQAQHQTDAVDARSPPF